MAAGLGFKTFTTGEVLTAADTNGYLMQGINVFASTAARDAAITSPQEGQFAFTKDTNGLWYYDGAAWVASGATGDIEGVTAGTGLTGGGTSGTVTLAFDVANYGGGSYAAGKNEIINGAFDVWQRGTSFTPAPAGIYTADRFMVFADGTGGTRTVSQQSFTPGNAITGYESQYYMRYATTVAPTGQGYNNLTQRIEDVRTLAGQTVTVSFWAKTDAAKTFTLQVNQNFGSGGSTEVYTGFTPGWTTTTSWARYSYSFTMPSISGKTVGTSSFVGIQILLPTTGTYTLEFWGVQLEEGAVATDFQTATGTLQGELAACQRYYQRITSEGDAYGALTSVGSYTTTTLFDVPVQFTVPLRVQPTAIDYANIHTRVVGGGSTYAITNVSIQDGGNMFCQIRFTAATATAGNMAWVQTANNSAGYIGYSAEL